jgi:hypothetical protein
VAQEGDGCGVHIQISGGIEMAIQFGEEVTYEMKRVDLAKEAAAAAKRAKHNLRWIEKHPDRIDQSKKEDMVAYLKMMVRFSKEEKKNDRRPGRSIIRLMHKFSLPHRREARNG